jgi:hypothetical protein
MLRTAKILALAAVVAMTLALPASAGNAHFVGATSVERSGDSLTVSGKVAGLGNIDQINVEITADAACVNPGTKKPKAANKQSFSTEGDFPVQNGKANFSLELTASFSPNCSPPMTVEFSNVTVTVTATGVNLTRSLSGTF